ncbi:MAG: hypothetical protein ACUVWB_00670 [Anaerolineae bacterium]
MTADHALHYLRLAIIALLIALFSGTAIVFLTYRFPPEGFSLALFFSLLFCCAAGLVMPLTLWVNRRLMGARRLPASSWRPIRWSAWIGLWVTLCIWLQYIRLLNVINAVLFVFIVALMEWLVLAKRHSPTPL